MTITINVDHDVDVLLEGSAIAVTTTVQLAMCYNPAAHMQYLSITKLYLLLLL